MYLRSDWFIQELRCPKFQVHIKMVKYTFKWGGVNNNGSDNHQDLTIYSTSMNKLFVQCFQAKSNWNLKFGTLAFHHNHRQAAPKMKLPLICSSHSLLPIWYL